MSSALCIDGFQLGEGKTFIIAELSANHNQSLQNALDTITAARDCGADAVKFQTYTADTITIDCDDEHFRIQKGTLWDGKTLYQLYQEAHTPWDWHPRLFEYAKECGLIAFSSPFDRSAVDFLDGLHVPAYKIASFELTDTPLIEYAAAHQKPMIMSTGIATIEEIQEAIVACKRVGNDQIILLKCTSAYPAPFSEVNLATMQDLATRFGVRVGLSDHTEGPSVPLAAVALGACVVEKHIILDRSMGGPDAKFSLEPHEFKVMVDGVRHVEQAMGRVTYELSPELKRSREFSRSLFVVEDVAAGETFTQRNVRSIRPSAGLAPKFYGAVLGRKAVRAISRGTPLAWDLIESTSEQE